MVHLPTWCSWRFCWKLSGRRSSLSLVAELSGYWAGAVGSPLAAVGESQIEKEADFEESRTECWKLSQRSYPETSHCNMLLSTLELGVLEANTSIKKLLFLLLHSFHVGRQFPRLSCVSACLMHRSIDCFCSRLSFQECLYSKRLWKVEMVCCSEVAGV